MRIFILARLRWIMRQSKMLPSHIYHADWGKDPHKRWLAEAKLGKDNRYTACAPNLLDNHSNLIPSIRRLIDGGSALVGFDFPIGIPAAYARLVGVTEFKPLLCALGNGEWADFYSVARTRSEIWNHRPFYSFAPGNKRQSHLLSALGLQSIDELRRECEKQQLDRRAACPLFWTLGANQVGKGALIGWREVLAPAIAEDAVLLWPFDGQLSKLLRPGNIVIAETYPAECYGWFFPEPLKGKGKVEVRKKAGRHLLKWAETTRVELDSPLSSTIREGFLEGDDAFDAVVGLFGMIRVVVGDREPGEPTNQITRTVEGWILGQAP